MVHYQCSYAQSNSYTTGVRKKRHQPSRDREDTFSEGGWPMKGVLTNEDICKFGHGCCNAVIWACWYDIVRLIAREKTRTKEEVTHTGANLQQYLLREKDPHIYTTFRVHLFPSSLSLHALYASRGHGCLPYHTYHCRSHKKQT